MTSISLEYMTDNEFGAFGVQSISTYAAEMVIAGDWASDSAVEQARSQWHAILPDGVLTEGHEFFKVTLARQIVGCLWISWITEPETLFLYDILIHEEFRGKGIGEAAMLELEKVARERGVCRIALSVFDHNLPARNLYQKLGFVEDGHRHRTKTLDQRM